MLVNDAGLPRYWSAVWQTVMGAHLAPSTLAKQLSVIEGLYCAAQDCFGSDCLDRLLADGAFDELETALESFFVAGQNRAAVAGTEHPHNWQLAVDFVKSVTVPGGGGKQALPEIAARLSRLDGRYRNFRQTTSHRKRPMVRALPADVLEELYSILDPDSRENPFRTETSRWRNYALFLLYLHQGLRRGEALLLPANAINQDIDPNTGELRHWITVKEPAKRSEPRWQAPSLKTELSRRQIPISAEITAIVEHYVDNYRGRQEIPYMFVSNQRKPLALNSVNVAFASITRALSDKARSSLKARMREDEVRPHDLRHTCAVVRLREFIVAGISMEEALQLLRALFGWSPSSDMPRHYARAFFEDRLNDVWRGKFEDRVGMLRQLREVEQNAGLADLAGTQE